MKDQNPIEIKRGKKTCDRIQAYIAKQKASAQPTTVNAGSLSDDADAQQAAGSNPNPATPSD